MLCCSYPNQDTPINCQKWNVMGLEEVAFRQPSQARLSILLVCFELMCSAFRWVVCFLKWWHEAAINNKYTCALTIRFSILDLISRARVKKASSTFMLFFADVSRNFIPYYKNNKWKRVLRFFNAILMYLNGQLFSAVLCHLTLLIQLTLIS